MVSSIPIEVLLIQSVYDYTYKFGAVIKAIQWWLKTWRFPLDTLLVLIVKICYGREFMMNFTLWIEFYVFLY